jgi:hypothetical protein
MPIQSMILELDNSLLITSHNYQLLDYKNKKKSVNSKKNLRIDPVRVSLRVNQPARVTWV